MIGMDVGFERIGQIELELLEQRKIPIDLVEHWIDEHRYPAFAAAQEIGKSAGVAVEQLTENHLAGPRRSKPLTRTGRSAPVIGSPSTAVAITPV